MSENSRPHLITFSQIGESKLGFISVAENSKLPFQVKRVYWTYFTPNEVIRGNHAHKELQQILIAASGIIKFKLKGIDGSEYSFELNKPNIGLFVPNMYWRTIEFSHSAVLLCLASCEYNEDDYIRDISKFA